MKGDMDSNAGLGNWRAAQFSFAPAAGRIAFPPAPRPRRKDREPIRPPGVTKPDPKDRTGWGSGPASLRYTLRKDEVARDNNGGNARFRSDPGSHAPLASRVWPALPEWRPDIVDATAFHP
jgi:hypothetical protein